MSGTFFYLIRILKPLFQADDSFFLHTQFFFFFLFSGPFLSPVFLMVAPKALFLFFPTNRRSFRFFFYAVAEFSPFPSPCLGFFILDVDELAFFFFRSWEDSRGGVPFFFSLCDSFFFSPEGGDLFFFFLPTARADFFLFFSFPRDSFFFLF